jgi:hypothetical protein
MTLCIPSIDFFCNRYQIYYLSVCKTKAAINVLFAIVSLVIRISPFSIKITNANFFIIL